MASPNPRHYDAVVEATIPLSPTGSSSGTPRYYPPPYPLNGSGGSNANGGSISGPSSTSFRAPVSAPTPTRRASEGAYMRGTPGTRIVAESISLVREAQREADQRAGEVAGLLHERDAISYENRSLQAQLTQLTREHTALLREYAETKRESERAETLRVQSVCAAQEERQKDEAQLFTLRHNADQLKRENERLKASLAAVVDDVAAHEEAKKIDSAALSNLMLEHEHLKRGSSKREEQLKGTEAQLARRNNEVTELIAEKSALEQRVGELTAELRATQGKVERATLDLAAADRSLSARAASLEESLKEAREERDTIQLRTADLARRLEMAKQTNEELAARVMQLEDERDDFKQRLKESEARLSTALEEKEAKVKELLAQNDGRMQQLSAIVAEQSSSNLTRSQQQLQALEALNAKLLAAQIAQHEAESKRAQAEDAASSASAEAVMQRKRFEVLEASLAERSAATETHRQAMRELQEALASERAKAVGYQLQISEKSSEAEALRRDLQEALSRCHSYLAAKAQLEAAGKLLSDRCAASEARHAEEKARLEAAESRNLQMNLDVVRARSSLADEQKARSAKETQQETSERTVNAMKAAYEERIRTLEKERDALWVAYEEDVAKEGRGKDRKDVLAATEHTKRISDLEARLAQAESVRVALIAAHSNEMEGLKQDFEAEKRRLDAHHRNVLQNEVEGVKARSAGELQSRLSLMTAQRDQLAKELDKEKAANTRLAKDVEKLEKLMSELEASTATQRDRSDAATGPISPAPPSQQASGGDAKDGNDFATRTRPAMLEVLWEMYGRTVVARRHLKNTFQLPSWRHAVDRQLISDDVGDGLCQVVEDIQFLHDRGYWLLANCATETEQRRLGATPSFFQQSPPPRTREEVAPPALLPRRMSSGGRAPTLGEPPFHSSMISPTRNKGSPASVSSPRATQPSAFKEVYSPAGSAAGRGLARGSSPPR